VLEELWQQAQEPQRLPVHGLLQLLPVGMHHLLNHVSDAATDCQGTSLSSRRAWQVLSSL